MTTAGDFREHVLAHLILNVTVAIAAAIPGNAMATSLCDIPPPLRLSDGTKLQRTLAKADRSMALTAYEFREAKDGLSALLMGFERGDGPAEEACANVGNFKFCPGFWKVTFRRG